MAEFAIYIVGAIVLLAVYLQFLRLRQIHNDLWPEWGSHMARTRTVQEKEAGLGRFIYCFTLGPVFAMIDKREIAQIRLLRYRAAVSGRRETPSSDAQKRKPALSKSERDLRRAMIAYWMRYRLPGIGILVVCAGSLFVGVVDAFDEGEGVFAALWFTLGLSLAFLLQWLFSWLYLGFGLAYIVAQFAERLDAEAPRVFLLNMVDQLLARPDLPVVLAVMLGSAVLSTAGDLLDLAMDIDG